jgi:hypothetical protein
MIYSQGVVVNPPAVPAAQGTAMDVSIPAASVRHGNKALKTRPLTVKDGR